MPFNLFIYLSFSVQISSSANCIVPDSDTIIFYILSDTSTEVVDQNMNYLYNAFYCLDVPSNWLKLTDSAWIWDQKDNSNSGIKYFKREFYILGTPVEGTLDFLVDNTVNIKINGKSTNFSGGFTNANSYDIISYLVPGFNNIVLTVTNFDGQGGLSYKLKLVSKIY